MAGYLSLESLAYKRYMKRNGLLVPFTDEELMMLTVAGGVSIVCSDNTIDADSHIKAIIPTNLNQFFGGPLQFARSYGNFNEAMARGLVDTMIEGMDHKGTRALFNIFHDPCGMATKYGHSLKFIVEVMVLEVVDFFRGYSFFDPARIHNLIHFKLLEEDGIKQRSYFLNLA
ncbi:MAG: hypothetical protein WC726_02590 [Parcubacteria group bacterium]|jgi:hypothetical protein